MTGRYGYRKYRSCLRWEFGFSCAFCLLHEADLFVRGAEGTGLTSVEHFVPVSDGGDPGLYENCFYACRFCNRSRADAPVSDRSGRRLLNPCREGWADHFVSTSDDRLVPVDGDADAAYTHETYDLDDPRKIVLRRSRRQCLEECFRLLREAPDLIRGLLERVAAQAPEPEELLRVAELLRSRMEAALKDVHRYAAIPPDSDSRCRCPGDAANELPTGLHRQTLEISLAWDVPES